LLLLPTSSWAWDWNAPWGNQSQMEFRGCATDLLFKSTQQLNNKGLVMDDITFRYCPSRIPQQWPNLKKQPVSSLRLFRSWSSGWPAERRELVWDALVQYVQASGAKIFFGSPITCDPVADKQDWEYTKTLIRRMGKNHVMAVAIGNELELLYGQTGTPPECIEDIWDKGRLWRSFETAAKDLNEMGLSDIPITTVFTAGIVYSGDQFLPFRNVPGEALVNSFLKNATLKYDNRFVFVVNIYPYFDPKLQVDPPGSCESAIEIATCFHNGCRTEESLALVREKMMMLTHRTDYKLWVGEIGWSSPKAAALATKAGECKDFSTLETFSKFYSNFLNWDISLPVSNGHRGPDHVFYFTLRDATNFGNQEHFGLISTCNDLACKIKTPDYIEPEVLKKYGWLNVVFAGIGVIVIASTLVCVLCKQIIHKQGLRRLATETDSDSYSDSSQ